MPSTLIRNAYMRIATHGPLVSDQSGILVRTGPIASSMLSRDLRRIFVLTRDYHGDAWISNVVR